MRIAAEALPFVLPVAGLALVLTAAAHWLAGLAIGLLSLVVALFFRIPRRLEPSDPRVVVAPANGRVLLVDEVEDPELGAGTWRRIVTFLSVLDVHVQRAPVGGEVIHTALRPGRKIAAFRPAAGEVNESRLLVLRADGGDLVGVRQIAGLLARRTVGYRSPGERVARGELIGLIKFGSRVDLLLPRSYALAVRPGERLREGETVVARSASP